jgi:His/Glu/Gln/Arg/opine family amino acid ABC transporter permease subunit
MINLQGYGWLLWEGAWQTVLVGIGSMVIAMLLGLLGAWGKLSRSKMARGITETYTTIIRGVPELVIILLVYYGVPTLIQDFLSTSRVDIVIDFNPFSAGIATIGFIYGAFATEVFRGSFMAVPKGQMEAAKAVGMSRIQAFHRVLMPQMWRFALPGLGNVWMVLIKATALVSVIQLPELMRNADIASRATKLPFTCYFAASLIYLGITVISILVQQKAEKWANRGIRRA